MEFYLWELEKLNEKKKEITTILFALIFGELRCKKRGLYGMEGPRVRGIDRWWRNSYVCEESDL